jgi:hypothetical protein
MENEERSQPEAQYQRELEGVRNDVVHLTSMLEQMLRARDGEGVRLLNLMKHYQQLKSLLHL